MHESATLTIPLAAHQVECLSFLVRNEDMPFHTKRLLPKRVKYLHVQKEVSYSATGYILYIPRISLREVSSNVA